MSMAYINVKALRDMVEVAHVATERELGADRTGIRERLEAQRERPDLWVIAELAERIGKARKASGLR